MTDSVSTNLLFPTISARSLSGCEYTLPADLGGERNVLVLMFQRRQQALVASWFSFLEQLMANHRDLRAYEVAIVPSVYTLARPFIDGGMIGGTPDLTVRERTLTVYTDVRQFTQVLQITTTVTITVLLIDRVGRILWRGQGGYDAAQTAALERAIGGVV
jgi:hypothetical protein